MALLVFISIQKYQDETQIMPKLLANGKSHTIFANDKQWECAAHIYVCVCLEFVIVIWSFAYKSTMICLKYNSWNWSRLGCFGCVLLTHTHTHIHTADIAIWILPKKLSMCAIQQFANTIIENICCCCWCYSLVQVSLKWWASRNHLFHLFKKRN